MIIPLPGRRLDAMSRVAKGRARRRVWTLRALALAVGMLVPLGGLEALLRTTPVYEVPRRMSVNAENPVIHFEPDSEFVWSRGWVLIDAQKQVLGFPTTVPPRFFVFHWCRLLAEQTSGQVNLSPGDAFAFVGQNRLPESEEQ